MMSATEGLSCNLCCGCIPIQMGSNLIGYLAVYQLINNGFNYQAQFNYYMLPLDCFVAAAFVYELYR